MKKVLMICLLAFGMNAAKAQCPIDEILTSTDVPNITTLIENNTDCLKQSLSYNPGYAGIKTYLDFIYNTSKEWVYHEYPDKEKQFTEFFAKWGKDYPTMTSPLPTDPAFYEALDEMVDTDPTFFAQKKVTRIPLRYQQWLYVKRLNEKHGEEAILNLTNAVSKIANLKVTPDNYSAFVQH